MDPLKFLFKRCQEMTNVLSSCRESLGKENVLSNRAFSSEKALSTPNTCKQYHEISSPRAVKSLSIRNV